MGGAVHLGGEGGDWVEVDQGEELLLTCESQGGRPHAELQWRDAEGQRVFGHVQEHITRIGTSSTFKTVSTLRFSPLPSILEAREGDWVEVDQGEELLLTTT